jgi:hypothetical protein
VDVVQAAALERLEALFEFLADARGGRLRELAESGLLAQRLDVAPITSAFSGSVRNSFGVLGNSLDANVCAASRTCGTAISSSPSAVCTRRGRNPLRSPLS